MMATKKISFLPSCLLLLLSVGIPCPRSVHADQPNQHKMLRGHNDAVAVVNDPSDDNNDGSPKLTDCLLSAVNSDDCGTVVEGCIWCAEPVYGLCVTGTAAKRMNVMPFFSCSLGVMS
mmetsp:Transcript_26559/g.56123  ORF Transcript_26559/g.56123 Transcript_26559/m.56123 type:complete len:118 (-) Transcript_26559:156-509(-)